MSDNILFKLELSEGIILLMFFVLIFQFSSINSSLSLLFSVSSEDLFRISSKNSEL